MTSLGEDMQRHKTPHTKLVSKVHVLLGQVASCYGETMAEYKAWYKDITNIKVSFADLCEDDLAMICKQLENIKKMNE